MATALEVFKTLRARLEDGTIDKDMPVFLLLGKDAVAPGVVYDWALKAKAVGCPDAKWNEAIRISEAMDAWPMKQLPGRPDTLKDRRVART